MSSAREARHQDGQKGRRWLITAFLIPALYVVLFFAYAGLSNDPGCGSQEPGLCFGAGTFLMVVAPVAIITTPVALILFLIHLIQSLKEKRRNSHE